MKLITFTLCTLALLAGCQRESGDAQNQKPAVRRKAPVAVQRGPTPQELTSGMVEAATLGKSQTPVVLKFDVLQRPVQGQPLEIALALLPDEAASVATVEVTGPDALPVPPDEAKFQFSPVEPAQVYRQSLRLTPAADGVFLLTLTVNLHHDQLADTRVFSVPLIVGATSPQTPASSSNVPVAPPASPSG